MYVLASGEELAELPEAVGGRMREAVAGGMPVEVLVLDHTVDAAPAQLPDGVTVRRFWEDAAPGDGAYVPGTASAGTALAGAAASVPVPRRDGGWMPGRYRDGLPTLAVETHPAGARVEHYGPAGLPVRRDELDQTGALVRVIDLNSAGAEVAHRYFDGSGACWLSVGVRNGEPGRVVRQLPRPAEYSDLAAAQAEWASRRVAAAVRPIVVSAGPKSSAVERHVRRRVLTRR